MVFLSLIHIWKVCPKGLVYECLCQFAERENFETEEEQKLRDKLVGFLEQLREIRDMSSYTPVHQLILYILRKTGYEDFVRALPGGSQRGANLRMLVEKAMDYEKTSYRGLFNFCLLYTSSVQWRSGRFPECRQHQELWKLFLLCRDRT